MRTKKPIQWGSFRVIAPYAGRYKLWMTISIAASLVSAGTDVLAGYAIQYLTDSTMNGAWLWGSQTILSVFLLVAAAVLAKYYSSFYSGRFGFSLARDVRDAVSSRLEHMRIADLDGQSGRIVTRLTSDVNTVQTFMQDVLPNCLYQTIVFLATFGYLTSLNWKLSVTAVASIPLTIYLVAYLSKPIGSYNKGEQEGKELMAEVAQDATGGIYIEKVYRLQEQLKLRFDVGSDMALKYSVLRQKRYSYLIPLFSVVRWIPLVSCSVYGGFLTFAGELTTGSLLAFIFLLNYLVNPLTMVQSAIGDFYGASVSAQRIGELLAVQVEEEGHSSFRTKTPTETGSDVIAFDDVFFGYNEDRQILQGVSFRVEAGKKVAFVGGSGSGKSTMLQLICGFREPQSGCVSLYGEDLKHWCLEEAREQLSLVSQDAFLFPGTVADNIAYGKPGATMEEIVEAAQMANAHAFIMDLPLGYGTPIGERGVLLSGGQKQRLTIARGILKNAPILLLDEPTSALDVQSEALVQDALERYMEGRTVIMVAHRLSTIKNADEIIVMHEGGIVEQGTHEELLACEGHYLKLYAKQMGHTNETQAWRTGGVA